jgi:hypothetical protein
MPKMHTVTTYSGCEVAVNATWPVWLDDLVPRGQIRCVTVSPDGFIGRLICGHDVVAETDATYATPELAERAVRKLVVDQMRKLLAL